MHVIEQRKSIRNYRNEPLSGSDLARIEAYINESSNLIGPYGNRFELELIIETNIKAKEKLGTYGFIKNAQGYLIGVCKNDPKAAFEFGYVFEGLVLYLTELGIGTCWVGGTFDRQAVMSTLSLAEDEIIPAISPVGYPQNSRHFKERVQRMAIRASQRKPEEELFFRGTFEQPLGDQAGHYRQALHYVRIGPSAQNKQPWQLIISEDQSKVHFYAVSALAGHKNFAVDPTYLDIGIAYHHFKAGVDEAGLSGKLHIEEPDIAKPVGVEYITTWARNGE
jgi:nitroreductase